jgi:hypothetical protein
MIKIIDNFLSDTESSMVEKSLSDCPWFLTYEEATVAPYKYLTMKDEITKEYIQFCHNLLDNNGNVVSNQYSFLINFLKNKLEQNVKVNKFLRMKINLQTQCSFSKEDFYNTPHLDRLDELKYFNAIYYVNDSDGDTFFFKKENNKYLITDKVSPKKGRLVVFDGDKYHSGRHPKESLKRVIINFNFL